MANSKIYLAILAIFLLLSGYHLGKDIHGWSLASRQPSVTHVVLFQYKKNASPEDIAEVSQFKVYQIYQLADMARHHKINSQMLALKEKCIHPVSHRRYIRSVTGGRDNSIEGLQVRLFPGLMSSNCD